VTVDGEGRYAVSRRASLAPSALALAVSANGGSGFVALPSGTFRYLDEAAVLSLAPSSSGSPTRVTRRLPAAPRAAGGIAQRGRRRRGDRRRRRCARAECARRRRRPRARLEVLELKHPG
jgi:hypothetical protein